MKAGLSWMSMASPSPLTCGVRRMLIMGHGDRRAKLAALSEPMRSA